VLGPVFLARDPERARSVALKVFRLDIAPEQAAELAAMRERFRAAVGAHAKALALTDELFSFPIVNAAVAARKLGVSDPTARKAISALEAVGLLEEFTGRDWGKTWVARPVMEVLERPL